MIHHTTFSIAHLRTVRNFHGFSTAAVIGYGGAANLERQCVWVRQRGGDGWNLRNDLLRRNPKCAILHQIRGVVRGVDLICCHLPGDAVNYRLVRVRVAGGGVGANLRSRDYFGDILRPLCAGSGVFLARGSSGCAFGRGSGGLARVGFGFLGGDSTVRRTVAGGFCIRFGRFRSLKVQPCICQQNAKFLPRAGVAVRFGIGICGYGAKIRFDRVSYIWSPPNYR